MWRQSILDRTGRFRSQLILRSASHKDQCSMAWLGTFHLRAMLIFFLGGFLGHSRSCSCSDEDDDRNHHEHDISRLHTTCDIKHTPLLLLLLLLCKSVPWNIQRFSNPSFQGVASEACAYQIKCLHSRGDALLGFPLWYSLRLTFLQ